MSFIRNCCPTTVTHKIGLCLLENNESISQSCGYLSGASVLCLMEGSTIAIAPKIDCATFLAMHAYRAIQGYLFWGLPCVLSMGLIGPHTFIEKQDSCLRVLAICSPCSVAGTVYLASVASDRVKGFCQPQIKACALSLIADAASDMRKLLEKTEPLLMTNQRQL